MMRWFWLLLISLGLTASTFAQPAPPLLPTGTDAFRGILKKLDFEPAKAPGEIQEDPENSLLIIFGETYANSANLRWLTSRAFLNPFLNNGGAVLIASDAVAGDNQFNPDWADLFGIAVFGHKIKTTNPDDAFMGNESCPYVRPLPAPWVSPEKAAADAPQQMFRGLNKIATNNPSLIYLPRRFVVPPVTPLAGFPAGSRLQRSDDAPISHGYSFFAVAKQFPAPNENAPRGRLLVLADQSVFANEMLLPAPPDDNDNFAFAINALEWLRNHPERKRVLLLNNGEIESNFNVTFLELPPPPLPPLPMLANLGMQHGNRIIADFEDRDWFNERFTRNINMRRFMQVATILATLLLMLYGLKRLFGTKSSLDGLIPPVKGELPQPAERLVTAKYRMQGLLKRDNFYEMAVVFVREHLASLGGIPTADGKMPKLRLNGGLLENSRLRKQIHELWKLAYGSSAVVINADRWLKLTGDMEQLEAHYDREHWSFAPIIEESV